ncbi:sulfotransferase [Alphaproteobacteria bacterium]|nr:sulfotransferase [Alphaproteobacteria bacterium]|tara:strand:- start:762 stop:1874 length:1113 start_codon:yes stop_codon:yes gene_type:complete
MKKDHLNPLINRKSLGSVDGIRPVFVSGVYRSSSTFLSAIIGCHEEYTATSSIVKFPRFCLGRYDPIDNEENYKKLIHESHKRVTTRWDIDFDAEGVLDDVAKRGVSYATLYDSIMSHILAANDGAAGTQWIEKIAVMWSRIPEFLCMFPQGKVIHVLRDPRSVAASYKKMTNEPGATFLDAAFNTVHAIQSIEKFQKDLGNERIMLLRSEDLLISPEANIRKICTFLDVPFSSRMLDPNTYGHIIGEDWRHNTSFHGEIKGFLPPSLRWRDTMTPAETMFIEMISQPYLAKYGYEADSHFPSKKDWDEIYGFLEDPFLRERFEKWLHTGQGTEGYRTDPYLTEMKIVFPERFEYHSNASDKYRRKNLLD